MKIAIDASHLTESNRTGTHNYLYFLLKNLSILDKSNDYIVYFKHTPSNEFVAELFNKNPKFHYKVLDAGISYTQYALAKELFTNTPDILFCPWHTMPFIHRKNMKIVLVMHGVEYSWLEAPHVILALHLCSKVIAVSEFTKHDVVKRYILPEHKITVIHEGVDTNLFKRDSDESVDRVRKKHNIDSEYVFFIGTVEPRKNLPNMLRAFSKYAEENSSVEFVIAGKFPPEFVRKHVEVICKNCMNRVKLIGRVSSQDLVALLSGSKCLMYVSKSEGFGLPLLEAMSCGVPVISTNQGAVPEVASDAAILCDPNNIEAIYNAVSYIFSNPIAVQELVEKGLRKVTEYSWVVTAAETKKVLEQIYEGK